MLQKNNCKRAIEFYQENKLLAAFVIETYSPQKKTRNICSNLNTLYGEIAKK